MQPLIRKIIAVILAVTLLVLAYLGSFLPMRKSTAFVRGIRAIDVIFASDKFTSELFENIMSKSLLMPSPIGQEEIVRQVTNIALDIIQQSSGKPKNAESLVNFAESFYAPIIRRGRGMSFSQNLYVLGLMHRAALMQTRDGRHLAANIAYYEEGLRLSPNRPQFLYGLFDAYRLAGDFEKARKIGEKIVANWPTDKKVAELTADLPQK